MSPDIDNVGIKSIREMVKRATGSLKHEKDSHKHDRYNEVAIELDGITELTRIDPNKFLRILQTNAESYKRMVGQYREKVLGNEDYVLSGHMVEHIVESNICLDALRSLVFEAGGYENALSYVAEKYKVDPDAISIDAAAEKLQVCILKDKEEIKEATHIITSFYGPKVAEELYSIFMISKVGRLIGVKNSAGRIVGVIQMLYDRWGDSYVHAYCVMKNYRGFGVGTMLLDAVEENTTGKCIWATRSLDMVYNIRNFLGRGYVGRAFIADYWGKGVPRIVFEKDLDKPAVAFDAAGVDIPHVSSYQEGLGVFSCKLTDYEVIQSALNEHSFEVVGISAEVEVDKKDEECRMIFRKTSSGSIFLSRDRSLQMPKWEFGMEDFKPVILRAYDEIQEVIGLVAKAHADPQEDYGTFKMLTYVGALLGLRDDESRLVASCGIIWDDQRGLFCHSLIVHPFVKKEGFSAVIKIIGGIAESMGTANIWFIHSIEDMPAIEEAINNLGFRATQEVINPYDNGQNYLVLKRAAKAQARSVLLGSDAPILRNFVDLDHSAESFMIYSRNFSLTELVLNEGYRIFRVIESAETGQQMFLMKK